VPRHEVAVLRRAHPRPCQRSPAPGYPDEERTVIDCISVVMDEEIEHYRSRCATWRHWIQVAGSGGHDPDERV
jgi:hypothetical protein